jgi:hypothetical protein
LDTLIFTVKPSELFAYGVEAFPLDCACVPP